MVNEGVEESLGEVLERIVDALGEDTENSRLLSQVSLSTEDAQELLLAVDEWASVASYAVAWVYAGMSPLPRNMRDGVERRFVASTRL